MFRIILIAFFAVILSGNSYSQVMSPSDAIVDKVVLYIPNASKAQLDNLAIEFGNYTQIKKAYYVANQHNCLLMDVKPDNNIRFYGDLMKIVSLQIPLPEMILKTPLAYSEIYGKGDNDKIVTLKQ